MNKFVINYDLNTKVGDVSKRYADILVVLDRLYMAVKLTESCYIVATSFTQDEVYNKIRQCMYASDLLAVVDMGRHAKCSDSCLSSAYEISKVENA